MTSAAPNYLPKAPLLNTITMGIKASTYELEVGEHKYFALSKEKGFWCFASLAPLIVLSLSTSWVMMYYDAVSCRTKPSFWKRRN